MSWQEHVLERWKHSKKSRVLGAFPPFLYNGLPHRNIRERTATNLVNAGATSVSDLRLPKYAALLTPTQKVGVLYGEHMMRPVRRTEAEEIAVRILCAVPPWFLA